MNKMKLLFYYCLVFKLLSSQIFAQQFDFVQSLEDTIFFNLSIGNKWYYQASRYNQSRHFNMIKTISDTTLTGTRLVSIKQIYPEGITYDSEEWIYTGGKFSIQPSSGDLRGPIFDRSITRDTVISNFIIYEAYKIINIPIFGNNYFGQHYFWSATSHVGSSGYEYKTANQIGTTFIEMHQYFGGSIRDTFYLKGVLIDNVLLGDSVLTHVTSDWTRLNSGVSNDLHSIYFTNENTGFAVGEDGLILMTTNAGDSWTSVSSGTNISLRSVNFFNSEIGFIAGFNGTILKTSDGGYNWSILTTGIDHDLYSVDVVSENIVYAVGEHGIFLKTTDSGNSWILKYTSTVSRLYSVFFNNSDVGYASGAEIVKTTDGGDSWITRFENTHLESIFFPGLSTGYTCGQYGSAKLLKSTDSGNTWFTQAIPSIYGLSSIFFISSEYGITVGYGLSGGTILRTTTGGDEWFDEPSGVYVNLNSVYIYSNEGYIVGNGGLILNRTLPFTADTNHDNLPIDYFLSQNYPNPFNPSTVISYKLPVSDLVTLKVYDVLGNEVATLVNEEKPAGTYEVEFDGTGLSSGIYFYQLIAGDYTETKKMVLIR